MIYSVTFKPKALKDLEKLEKKDVRNILIKIEALADNLAGDVKRLTDYSPEYRLRVGKYRILFEIEQNVIIIYRIRHRKNAYA